MIKKYTQFVNESLKDKMIGKSDEEIESKLDNYSSKDLYNKSLKSGYLNGVKKSLESLKETETKEKLKDLLGGGIFVASREGYYDIVKFLLENGADPNHHFNIAIRWAVTNGYTDIFNLLLEHGANIEKFFGEFLSSAIMNEHIDIKDILLKMGADIQDAFHYTISNWNNADMILKYINNYDVDINYNDGEPLKKSLSSYRIDTMKCLLENGADPNVIDIDKLKSDNSESVKDIIQLLEEYKKK